MISPKHIKNICIALIVIFISHCGQSGTGVGTSDPTISLPATLPKIDYAAGDVIVGGSFASTSAQLVKYATDSTPTAVYVVDVYLNVIEATVNDNIFYAVVPGGILYTLIFQYDDELLLFTDITTGVHSVPLMFVEGAAVEGEYDPDSDTNGITVIDLGSFEKTENSIQGTSSSESFENQLGLVSLEDIANLDGSLDRLVEGLRTLMCEDPNDVLCGSKNSLTFSSLFGTPDDGYGDLNSYLDPSLIEFTGWGSTFETNSDYLLDTFSAEEAFLTTSIAITTQSATYAADSLVVSSAKFTGSADEGFVFFSSAGDLITNETDLFTETRDYTVSFGDGSISIPFTITPPGAVDTTISDPQTQQPIPMVSYSLIDDDSDNFIDSFAWRWVWYKDGSWQTMTNAEVFSVVKKPSHDDEGMAVMQVFHCAGYTQSPPVNIGPDLDLDLSDPEIAQANAEGEFTLPAPVDNNGSQIAEKFYFDPDGGNGTYCGTYISYYNIVGYQYQLY